MLYRIIIHIHSFFFFFIGIFIAVIYGKFVKDYAYA